MQNTINMQSLSNILNDPMLMLVTLALGFFLKRQITATPSDFSAWVDFSEAVLERLVNEINLLIMNGTLSQADFLVLERFLRLVASSHHSMTMGFIQALPNLFPNQDIHSQDIPEIYRFIFNQQTVDGLVDLLRHIITAAAELG